MKGQKFYVDLMQDSAEVTGSFTLAVVKIGEKTIKFAVDCGLYQEKEHEEQNATFIAKPENVDFVILTHNHVDHNGRLPYFVKKGFYGKIYTTKVTKSILGRALNDNAKVLRDTSKRRNSLPLYDLDDVEHTLSLVEGFEYNRPIRVNDNITITFVPNGHLIGAASVLVQIHCPGEDKDINLLFSGDYNNKNLFFKVAPVRKWITKLPINIVVESTYGYMTSKDIKEVFVKRVVKAIEKKKTVIVPVFSLGRAQEILYYFKDMQRKYPELFANVPIYYDGKLSFYYTEMYHELQEKGLIQFYQIKKDFLPENLHKVEDKNMRREFASDLDSCKVIITTSGMGSYGPAQFYIPLYIGVENALIHFTGYCAEGTLGYRLKQAGKGEIVEVSGVKVIKRADVEFTNEFSAHAKADELTQFVKKFENPLFVMVNHGEDTSKDKLAERILREVDVGNVGILGREFYYRIDKNGFVKSYTTKFL